MKTLSVQQMPHGYELEAPSAWYWVKVGAAFALGALGVYVAAAVAWFALLLAAPSLLVLRALMR